MRSRILSLSMLIAAALLPAHWMAAQEQMDATRDAKPDAAAGKAIFEGRCAACHGIDGGGGRGPNLRVARLKHAADERSLRYVIENGIGADMPAAWFLSELEIGDVAAFVRSLGSLPAEKIRGDVAQGQVVYARLGCAACHILAGQGNGYGPDLNDVGIRRGAAQLRDTLRNPARNIPEGFLLVEATLANGQMVRGARLNEDSFSIQIKDMTGRSYSLRKGELTDLRKLRGQTPMPAYEPMFSSADLDNLVAYLAAQRGNE